MQRKEEKYFKIRRGGEKTIGVVRSEGFELEYVLCGELVTELQKLQRDYWYILILMYFYELLYSSCFLNRVWKKVKNSNE